MFYVDQPTQVNSDPENQKNTVYLDDEEQRRCAWAIRNQIEENNIKNFDKFTEHQRQVANELYNRVQSSYMRSRVFTPNYREKLISVKVENTTLADSVSRAVHELDMWAKGQGIKKVRRGRSTLYRIK